MYQNIDSEIELNINYKILKSDLKSLFNILSQL